MLWGIQGMALKFTGIYSSVKFEAGSKGQTQVACLRQCFIKGLITEEEQGGGTPRKRSAVTYGCNHSQARPGEAMRSQQDPQARQEAEKLTSPSLLLCPPSSSLLGSQGVK